jgi:hypothetical protein
VKNVTECLDRKEGTDSRELGKPGRKMGIRNQEKRGKPIFGKVKNGMGIGRHRKMRDRWLIFRTVCTLPRGLQRDVVYLC